METFLGAMVLVVGLLLASATPVLVVAVRQGRPVTAYRFVVAAVVIGFFFGMAAIVSERLIEDCGRSGSIACLDVGYQGLLLLIVVLYAMAAAVRFVQLWRS